MKQSRIIIENAYTMRRPFSPGNPITRRGLVVDERWPYASGLLQTVTGGKWLNYTDRSMATPGNQIAVVSGGGSIRLDAAAATNENWVMYPVAAWPQLNVSQMYRVQGVFNITDYVGIRACGFTFEGGNPGGGQPNNVGTQFSVRNNAGFATYDLTAYNNAVLATGNVNVGFGAGILAAGVDFTLRADIMPGAPRTVNVYVNDVLQATGNMPGLSGMLGVGVYLSATLAQFDHVFCRQISYYGSSL